MATIGIRGSSNKLRISIRLGDDDEQREVHTHILQCEVPDQDRIHIQEEHGGSYWCVLDERSGRGEDFGAPAMIAVSASYLAPTR